MTNDQPIAFTVQQYNSLPAKLRRTISGGKRAVFINGQWREIQLLNRRQFASFPVAMKIPERS